jgi:hypothetical protein
MTDMQEEIRSKKSLGGIEMLGLALVGISLVLLVVNPKSIAGLFNAMVDKTMPIVVKVYLTGSVGTAILCSVMMGRILERCGFTDALMHIFVPLAKVLGVNGAVIIPSVYNILGDINAAGRIAGPILVKAGATKDEQKIAIATMVQSQQSFSTFMFGLVALTAVGVKAYLVVLIAVFAPLVVVPWLLRLTLWRNTKSVPFDDLPRFTPTTDPLQTIFGAAKEGASLLFLLIIPAAAAVFALIGALDFVGAWAYIEKGLTAMLTFLNIDPATGTVALLASPTLAMAQLKDMAATLPPNLVIGSFVLSASGFPFSVIFGQIPTIWSECTDLSEKEAMGAAVLGAVMRVITAGVVASLLTPLLV